MLDGDLGKQEAGANIAEVEFTGLRGPLFKLALKNSLFTLLTLGIYRFWAKTWVRRYFWHNIRIRGEALEYTGLPSELLIGFLIALAILTPIFVVYESTYFFIGDISEMADMLLTTAYGLTLLAFFQYAFYRMWRYRLSRTVWRGIHFGLDGSALKYVAISLGWLIVTILTLGLAYPWYRVARWRYRTQNMRFGNSQFEFAGSANKLIKTWLIVVFLPIFLIVALGVLHTATLLELNNLINSGSDRDTILRGIENALIGPLGYSLILAVLIIITQPILYIWYRVREAQYLIGLTACEDAQFEAPIRILPIIGAYLLAFMFIILLASLLGIVWLGILSVYVSEAQVISNDQATSLGEIAGLYLMIVITLPFLALLVTPVITQLVLHYNITKHTCSVLRIKNSEAFDLAVQSAKQGPQHGEGLADALDVGAI